MTPLKSGLAQAKGLMVLYAKQKIGSREWSDSAFISATSTGKDISYQINLNPASWDKRGALFSFKCNMFVADIARLAGTHTWNEIAHQPTINVLTTSREPTAREWATATFRIAGWAIVNDCEFGDVASNGHHMGIASSSTKLISASSRVGAINEVDWDEMKIAIKRRFIGLTENEILDRLPKTGTGKTIRTF